MLLCTGASLISRLPSDVLPRFAQTAQPKLWYRGGSFLASTASDKQHRIGFELCLAMADQTLHLFGSLPGKGQTCNNQLRPEGRNTRGETRLGGPEVLGPSGALEFDPSFQQFGVSETASQGPLRAPERLSGALEQLFRRLGKRCPFSTEREKKVGHSEASKRLSFPGCPLRGFQPSGSYPRATDKTNYMLSL